MDKKEQVLSALAQLSRSRGLYRVTVDELAATAGVSKRTIYRYFRSKDEIVATLLERFMHQMAGRIEEIVHSTDRPADIFAGVVEFATQTNLFINNPLVLEDLRRYYPHLWKELEQFRAGKIHHFFRVLMEKRGGKDWGGVDPGVFTAAFTASVQAVINPEFILNNGLSFEETVKQLVRLFMHGIG